MLDLKLSALARFCDRLSSHSRLDEGDRDAINRLPGLLRIIDPHRDFVSLGDERVAVHLLATGMVASFDDDVVGEREVTAFFVAGDMCDLDSLVAPLANTGLRALNRVTLVAITHADMWSLAQRRPAVAEALWRDNVLEARILVKWIANIGAKDARSRLAHLLCEIGVRMERALLGDRRQFDWPVTQEQVGSALGITSVHVNRTLRKLKADGLVEMGHRRVRIHDWNALARVGRFRDRFLSLGTEPDHEGQPINASRLSPPSASSRQPITASIGS